MRVSLGKSAVAAMVALLAGCASGVGASSNPSAPLHGTAPLQRDSSCPCIYVTNDNLGGQKPDSVLVLAGDARGRDVSPIQDISGSNTHLSYPSMVAVGASGNIYVVNVTSTAVLGFAAGATGNVAPIVDLHGPQTNLLSPSGIAVNPLNGDIYVANQSNGKPHTPEYKGYVLIFSPNATGDAPPKGIIAGNKTNLNDPAGLAFDAAGNLYVANQVKNGVAVYAAGSEGNVAPTQLIAGKTTELVHAEQAVPDANLNIHAVEFAGYDSKGSSALTFAAGSNGDAAPAEEIKSGLLLGIALDAAGNSYLAKSTLRGASIAVFAAGANGQPKPINTIQCPSCLSNIGGIAIH